MAIIALEGVRFYAYHGFYEEENTIGNEFILDIFVDADTEEASAADDLFSTVNYETIYLICQVEMRKTTKLLESVAQRILTRIHDHFDNVEGVRVKMRKLSPPLGGRVEAASVEVSSGSLDQTALTRMMELLGKIL